MHSLYFAVVDSAAADDAKQAMDRAESFLNENNFTSDGLYGGGKADWFQIGGRWSGLFSYLTWAKSAQAEIARLEQESGIMLLGCWYGDEKKRARQAALLKKAEKIWASARPKEYAGVTFYRTMYGPQGDDAMRLTPELIAAIKSEWPDVETAWTEGDVCEETAAQLSEEDIGRWIVLIDYHI